MEKKNPAYSVSSKFSLILLPVRSFKAKLPTVKFLHKRNDKGETLLHRACQRSDLAQVRMLLQAGIGVNVEDNAGLPRLTRLSLTPPPATLKSVPVRRFRQVGPLCTRPAWPETSPLCRSC